MARINLLPWRDEYRREKQQEFLTILVGIAVIAGLASYLWVSSVNGAIESQQKRNKMLEAEITALDDQVKEIRELRNRRTELLDRMKVIQALQGERPVIVRYFDELVRAIPEGVYLTSLNRQGDKISLSGITESNVRVSAFMRNLDESDWFSTPNLSSVKSATQYGEQASEFSMSLLTSKPKDTDAEAKEG